MGLGQFLCFRSGLDLAIRGLVIDLLRMLSIALF